MLKHSFDGTFLFYSFVQIVAKPALKIRKPQPAQKKVKNFKITKINFMLAYTIQENEKLPIKKEIECLPCTPDEVLVDVLASALNHRDVWITKGMYPSISYGAIMGSDACVSYDAAQYIINPSLNWGSNPLFQSHQFEVLGVPTNGTFAEKIVISRQKLFKKPDHLNIFEAAALPLAGLTAFRALMVRGQLKKGEKVLISGIGGGVALMALQMALAAGAEVLVTSSSEEKIKKAIELGAKSGFLYSDTEWSKKLILDEKGVDVVIDGAGGDGLRDFIKISNFGGRIVFYGGTKGNMNNVNPQIIFWRQLSLLGTTMGSDNDFAEMLKFVTEHKIKPIIDNIIPFEDIPQGFARMESGLQLGKIVFRH